MSSNDISIASDNESVQNYRVLIILWLHPLMPKDLLLSHLHLKRPKQAWQIWKYIIYESIFWKKLKEKCFSESTQQLLFKYFVNFRLIPKLFWKVWEQQTILS